MRLTRVQARRLPGLAAVVLAAGLAGCVDIAAPAAPQAPSMPAPADDTCGAAPHAGLIGQDATALERVSIMRQVRVIRPGMAVTEDYRPERINFVIDSVNRIARIYCS